MDEKIPFRRPTRAPGDGPDKRVVAAKREIEGTKRLNIYMSEAMHEKLRVMAFQKKKRMAVLVKEVVENWLKRQDGT